jgi:hypothetical protein
MGRGWGGPDPRELVQVLPASGAADDRGSGKPLLPADAGPLPHAAQCRGQRISLQQPIR